MSEMAQERTANVVLTADVDPYRQSIQQAGQDTSKLTANIDKLTRSLDNLSKSAGKKMAFFGAGTTATVIATTVAFAKFDKQMTALKVNAEVTGRSYENMARSVNSLRREFGISTTSAVQLNRQIYAFRDGTKPVDDLTKTFVRLGVAVGEAPETMARGMLQLQRSMGTTQRDTVRYANTLTDLAVKSGQSASGILEFSQAIAPIGKIAGMQQSEIMGVSTAFMKAGQDGYMAANAFNKMLSDIMYSVQTGSPDLAKYANLIGVTVSQFKEMDKTKAITAIFDELNRLGPDAVQVLNRLGLDGMRMQRAIAGVSQQSGGIGTAVSQAILAYNEGGGALNRGSDVALDGVADRMGRIAESTKQMGEAFGSAFQGPAKGFLGIMQAILDTVNKLAASPLGQLAASIGGLVGGGMLAAAPLIGGAGTLMTLAMARQATSNWFTKGVRDRFAERTAAPGVTPILSAAGQRVRPDADGNLRAHRGQRLLYAAGYLGPGALLPAIAPGTAGYPSRILGAAARTGALGLNILAGGFTGLQHPFDEGKRVSIFSTPQEKLNGGGWGPGGVFSSGVTSGTGAANQGLVSRSMMLGRRIATIPFQNTGVAQAGWFSGAAPNLAKFGEAGLKFTGAAAGAVGGLAGVGANLAWRGLSALGPMGIATMGIPMAMMAQQAISSRNQGTYGPGEDNVTLMNSYRSALGEATAATVDFATALRNSTPDPKDRGRAMTVTGADKARAMNMDYFNPQMKDISWQAATQLLGGAGDGTPKEIHELKLDLLKRFGRGRADDIEALLRQPGSNFTVGGYMGGMRNLEKRSWGNFLGLRADESLESQLDLLDAQITDGMQAASVKGGAKAGARYQTVATNQVMANIFKLANSGKTSGGTNDKLLNFIDEVLFSGNMDIGVENNDPLSWASNFMQFDVDAGAVSKAFRKGNTQGIQEFWKQALAVSKDENSKTYEGVSTRLSNMNLTRKEALAQVEAGRGSLFNMSMSSVEELNKNRLTPAERTQARIFNTAAGRTFSSNTATMAALNAAVASPGNQNMQITAVDEMIRALRKSGNSFSEIDQKLIRFQAAIQDPTNELYNLAQAARGLNSQNLQFKLPFMSSGERFGAQAAGFSAIMMATDPRNPEVTDKALKERKDAKAAFAAFKISERDRVYSLYRQQQEFDIARDRSNYDFYQVQLPRMEEQFNLSRARAWEDYNISRSRAEQEFSISQRRSAQQFGLSLKDSYQDFHISRKRAEADFAHQQELLAKQMAQQQYNVYERLKVQRTWSGTSLVMNSQEQLAQMRQQNNDLDRLRKMGMSKLAIQQMNFTSPENAQQLERFMLDANQNPELIQQLNNQARRRLKQGKELATDPANPQWDEMRRQFRLTMDRGADDFQRAMARNKRNYSISMNQAQADFGRSMRNNASDMKRAMNRSAADYDLALGNMTEDYERQQKRAAKDLKRMQKELTMSFGEVLKKASASLSGEAKEQVDIVIEEWERLKNFLKNNKLEFTLNVDWRNDPGVRNGLGEPVANRPRGTDGTGQGAKPTNHTGGVYRGSQLVWVAETANEAVVPLNRHGAAFMAAVLSQYSGEIKRVNTSGKNGAIGGGQSAHYYRVDKSTNFTGPVMVSGVENPRQLAEKARMEARKKRLTKGTR